MQVTVCKGDNANYPSATRAIDISPLFEMLRRYARPAMDSFQEGHDEEAERCKKGLSDSVDSMKHGFGGWRL